MRYIKVCSVKRNTYNDERLHYAAIFERLHVHCEGRSIPDRLVWQGPIRDTSVAAQDDSMAVSV